MRGAVFTLVLAWPVAAIGGTRPVPDACTGAVNRNLVSFIGANMSSYQGNGEAHLDNVMVCGTATRPSFSQHSSARTHHGGHQVLSLTAPTEDGRSLLVEIVTNDELDGKVTAQTGDAVFAYGQAYIPSPNEHRPGDVHFAAGIHDTHCATHQGADDGWVVVARTRYPPNSCPVR
ncbi:hypothetical protein ACPOL_1812 [Acidisarcina polymorpha]|uniref:Uncharacterized protein n=2 Tax=Acidisarcina polymorpha TaxID=2211140 RepID=A0A2Z5FXB8_9BACT|nr:hypothetical protein ACPOL_1812 [Acidisarcina polymorpha]